MQNNDNQTNQNDPLNGGQNGDSDILPGLCTIWLGMRDSNPRSWDQNPVPYRLANPQREVCCNPLAVSRKNRGLTSVNLTPFNGISQALMAN